MSEVVSCILSSSRGGYGRCFPSVAVLIAIVLPLAGCGGTSSGDRVPLEGTVTVSGEPLTEKATIYFDPVAGQGGIGSSGEIKDGRFEISAESGPTPGKKFNVKVITSPGIPADDTPRDQIKLAVTYETTVEIPSREEGVDEIEIAFE